MGQEVEFELSGHKFGQAASQSFIDYAFERSTEGMSQFCGPICEVVVKSESCSKPELLSV